MIRRRLMVYYMSCGSIPEIQRQSGVNLFVAIAVRQGNREAGGRQNLLLRLEPVVE
jgi:hypothetical protein